MTTVCTHLWLLHGGLDVDLGGGGVHAVGLLLPDGLPALARLLLLSIWGVGKWVFGAIFGIFTAKFLLFLDKLKIFLGLNTTFTLRKIFTLQKCCNVKDRGDKKWNKMEKLRE